MGELHRTPRINSNQSDQIKNKSTRSGENKKVANNIDGAKPVQYNDENKWNKFTMSAPPGGYMLI